MLTYNKFIVNSLKLYATNITFTLISSVKMTKISKILQNKVFKSLFISGVTPKPERMYCNGVNVMKANVHVKDVRLSAGIKTAETAV